MAEHAVLETRDLTIRFGGHVAVDHVSCAFQRGTLTAIVGPNGAGKTTYFNLISGQLPASAGEVLLNGEAITAMPVALRAERGIGRAFQLTNLFPNLSVRENVRLVIQARAKKGFDLFSMADSHEELIERAEHVLAPHASAPSSRTRRSPRSPMATSASWRWRCWWRWSPTSSCSTSRPPA